MVFNEIVQKQSTIEMVLFQFFALKKSSREHLEFPVVLFLSAEYALSHHIRT